MKMYQSEQVVMQFSTGNVLLDAEQAKRRLHNLKPLDVNDEGAGLYEIINPIQFKNGEVFGYSGTMPKAYAHKTLDAGPSRQEPEADNVEDLIGDDIEYPKHLGGPHYQLSNGNKVKGRQKAEAAQAELDANG